MARITVEDCLKQIPNRFKLTLVATYRARQLAQGHAAKLESKDKPTVTALREIAAGLMDYAVIAEAEIVEDEPLFAAFEDESSEAV